MSYYPQQQHKEPSGCMQTLVISKVMLAILLVPMALVLMVIFAVVLAFYALTISPFLALLVIGAALALLVGVGKWEARRVAKEHPPDEYSPPT